VSRSRFSVEPGDVPPQFAARRMGLTLEAFDLALADLIQRGFPAADPTTGNYDLDAVDAWRRRRHERGAPAVAKTATRALVNERLMRL
jgi:hypothetical protein